MWLNAELSLFNFAKAILYCLLNSFDSFNGILADVVLLSFTLLALVDKPANANKTTIPLANRWLILLIFINDRKNSSPCQRYHWWYKISLKTFLILQIFIHNNMFLSDRCIATPHLYLYTERVVICNLCLMLR